MGRLLTELKKTVSEMSMEELTDQVFEIRKGRSTMTVTKIEAVRKRTKKTSLKSLLTSLSADERKQLLKEYGHGEA